MIQVPGELSYRGIEFRWTVMALIETYRELTLKASNIDLIVSACNALLSCSYSEARPTTSRGDTLMPGLGIAAAPTDQRSQFLDGLIPDHREKILAAAIPSQFSAKSVVSNQDNPAEHFFLLTRGLARAFFVTEEGKKLLFQWLGPGDLFGGRTVLSDPCSYLFGIETVTDSLVLVWDRSTIRDLVMRYPRLLENVLSTASDYVAWHLASHVDLACHTSRQRVAQVLITLARTIGKKVAGGTALQITNEELANAANVTPFTASRLMSKWRRERALVKRRGEVLLRSPERLLLRAV